MQLRLSRAWICGALVALVALSGLAVAEERATFGGDRLTVRSLIGEVRVESGGSQFEVVVRPQGRDAREGLIRLEQSGDEILIVFPEGQDTFVYPKLGGGSTTINTKSNSGWLSRLFGSDRIKVRGSGSGMELWADVVVRVPSGSALELEHAVGAVIAENVDADLELSTRSGDITVDGARGEISVATGSGDVRAARVSSQELRIATGSGDVDVEACDGDSIHVATGSGDITAAVLQGREVHLATGSGDIEVTGADLDELQIGTGSGDVDIALDRMGSGDMSVGTGSGDISLQLPAGLAADVHAETDRGEIEVDLAGAEFQQRDEDEVRFTIGGGGSRITLGSGVGDITLRH